MHYNLEDIKYLYDQGAHFVMVHDNKLPSNHQTHPCLLYTSPSPRDS